jgi:hypothetical protein
LKTKTQNPINLTDKIISEKIELFSNICRSTKFKKVKSTTKPNRLIDPYKMDFKDPLKRGRFIENLLVHKISEKNFTKSIHRLNGRKFRDIFKLYLCESISIKIGDDTLFIKELPFGHLPEFKLSEIILKREKIFKAKRRCITKSSIDPYCFIDTIIDDTIVEIKTDINIKSLTKYLKQALIQSLGFANFLSAEKEYDDESRFSKKHIALINQKVEYVGIYFWRTNEFFKYKITDIIPQRKYNMLVKIYNELQNPHATKLRKIMEKNLFLNNAV